jgi:hypothetical protein
MFHKTPEAVWMSARQLATLPVQTFVHVKNHQVAQADPFGIHLVCERLIPAVWPTGDNGTGGLAALIMNPNLIDQFPRHHLTHLYRVFAEAKRNLVVRVIL